MSAVGGRVELPEGGTSGVYGLGVSIGVGTALPILPSSELDAEVEDAGRFCWTLAGGPFDVAQSTLFSLPEPLLGLGSGRGGA